MKERECTGEVQREGLLCPHREGGVRTRCWRASRRSEPGEGQSLELDFPVDVLALWPLEWPQANCSSLCIFIFSSEKLGLHLQLHPKLLWIVDPCKELTTPPHMWEELSRRLLLFHRQEGDSKGHKKREQHAAFFYSVKNRKCCPASGFYKWPI